MKAQKTLSDDVKTESVIRFIAALICHSGLMRHAVTCVLWGPMSSAGISFCRKWVIGGHG